MELGADDFISKPFSMDELLAAVRVRLEKHDIIERLSEKKLEELRGNIRYALPHELRTPLSGILGIASLLMEECRDIAPERIYEYASTVYSSAKRLHRLIENFLMMAQIDLMSVDPEMISRLKQTAPIATEEVVNKITCSCALKAQRLRDIVMDLQSGEIRMMAEHFTKILEELIDNAFKFSATGSEVKVESRHEDHSFLIQITDHGRGMTAEQIAKIGPHMQFERRLHEQQGSGLGLAIAGRLLKLYDGDLTIESSPDIQTAIALRFPAL